MPWCPKCRAEYRPHIARCAECDLELVDERPGSVKERPPEPEATAFGEGEEFEQVLLCSVGEAYVTGIFVHRRDLKRAR